MTAPVWLNAQGALRVTAEWRLARRFLTGAANGNEPKFDFSAGTFFTCTLPLVSKICTWRQ